MKSEFIVFDKGGEEAKWIWNFLNDILYWLKYQLFMSIVIINQQLEGHKVVCIMVSLDIYIIKIIPLNFFLKWNYFHWLCKVKGK